MKKLFYILLLLLTSVNAYNLRNDTYNLENYTYDVINYELSSEGKSFVLLLLGPILSLFTCCFCCGSKSCFTCCIGCLGLS